MSKLKSNKKSQGLQINLVIVAILGLVVLVVIIAIFTGQIKIFSETLQSCESRQGTCVGSQRTSCLSNEISIKNVKCSEGKLPCCISVLNPDKE